MKTSLVATLFRVLPMVSLIALAGCGASPSNAERLVRKLGSDRLAQEAQTTYSNYLRLRRASATWSAPILGATNSAVPNASDDTVIPAECWSETLRSLHPKRIYLHRMNVVVVLNSTPQTEDGLYLTLLISSFAPMGQPDGFTFVHLEKDVYAFTRVLQGTRSTRK